MDRLVTIRLHGPLAETYGDAHRFAIRNPREAIDALDANFPGFRRDFLKVERYGLLVDGDWREQGDTDGEWIALAPAAREIDFCPIIEGRIVGAIVAAVTAVTGITGIAATIIGGVIAVGLLVGVSMLLSPKIDKKTAEDSKKDESYAFSGPENVTEQGVAVPLIYGRVHTGSVVVSAGLEVAEQFIPSATTSTAVDGMSGDWLPVTRRPFEEPPLLAPEPPGRSRRWIPDNA